MSLKRILLSAPTFFFTFAAGVVTAAAATALAAFLWPAPAKAAKAVEPHSETIPVASPASTPLPVMDVDADPKYTPAQEVSEEAVWYGAFDFDTESLPKAFRDLTYIDIVRYDFEKNDKDGKQGVLIPPKGYLKAGKEFRFKRIGIAGKEIAFQTETVNGVSYRFIGRYLALDYCETEGPTPDISGELIKIVDGKWAASTNAKLYEQGCGC